jgi:hypothetical protein
MNSRPGDVDVGGDAVGGKSTNRRGARVVAGPARQTDNQAGLGGTPAVPTKQAEGRKAKRRRRSLLPSLNAESPRR